LDLRIEISGANTDHVKVVISQVQIVC